MLHLFFMRQGDVARESSALLAPHSMGHTASAAVLLYLLTGQDANDLAKMENFDIEVGGFKKSVSMGGGFCGILNTITTLAMSAYLIDLGRSAPSFYAVDSSLTQLSEAEHKEQGDTIKQNFIEYLVAHAHDRQTIIVEQTKRMLFVPDEDGEKGIHVIQFSKNRNGGRYGFLNDVYNPEDQ